jgi:tetratricopeptide (TPR) repeat protein
MVQQAKKPAGMKGEESAIPPSPMEVMLNAMNSGNGMSCEIKRKMPDGSLEDAGPKQLSGLSTKSRVAYATQNLKKLAPKERLAWAIEMKDYANELYANNDIQLAMEKYVEALSASDFGKKEGKSGVEELQEGQSESEVFQAMEEGNIDSLVIPCLSNLSACCIQMRDFAKALKFADTALELRPKCGKALMRRGMSLVYIGDYTKGIIALQESAKITVDENAIEAAEGRNADAKKRMIMPVSESDRQRIPILIDRAEKGIERDARTREKQKSKLQKVFGGDKQQHKSATAALNEQQSRETIAADTPGELTKQDSSKSQMLLMVLALVVAIAAFQFVRETQ